MDEVARAIADHDGRTVNWNVNSPLFMLDELRDICDATDAFLLDRPGYRVTVTVERHPGLDTPAPGLLAGDAGV